MSQFEDREPGVGRNLDEIDAWLRSYLSSGPKPAAEVIDQAMGAGYTKKMVRLASDRLAIVRERDGFGPGSRVLWHMPSAH
ncbi:hypothetical protein [Pseudoxanthomonas indica]|uniref:hypothetical protein n=1 Tax=Pseudoxanthomonas indica TaxID=428993 RepID=UPI0009A6530F|nr:hypothetical protein [Pseudoxanthomonas indica]GGD58632.1 hypothetical protein GCM10007235_33670 [Pseudoxanthomonas indica]